MDVSPDDVAGVVDLFGALTPAETRAALAELAYKRGHDHDPDAFETDVVAAREAYAVVAVDVDGETVLVVGPAAFPTLPEGGEDLPHIMDVPDREVDRDRAAEAAHEQFREDAAGAVEARDQDRIDTLLDVSYELEAWGDIDLAETRGHLDAARDETN